MPVCSQYLWCLWPPGDPSVSGASCELFCPTGRWEALACPRGPQCRCPGPFSDDGGAWPQRRLCATQRPILVLCVRHMSLHRPHARLRGGGVSRCC
eukprot:226010-Chlamydomonas_euryale.AAC.2